MRRAGWFVEENRCTDDLDRAYLKELKESGVSDSLLEQFRSMMIEQNEEEKENH